MSDFPINLKIVARDGNSMKVATGGGFEFAVPADFAPSGSPGENFACPLGELANNLSPAERDIASFHLLNEILAG